MKNVLTRKEPDMGIHMNDYRESGLNSASEASSRTQSASANAAARTPSANNTTVSSSRPSPTPVPSPVAAKALTDAGLPDTPRNRQIISSLISQELPIDADTLKSVIRTANAYPNESIDAVILLQSAGVEVNPSSLADANAFLAAREILLNDLYDINSYIDNFVNGQSGDNVYALNSSGTASEGDQSYLNTNVSDAALVNNTPASSTDPSGILPGNSASTADPLATPVGNSTTLTAEPSAILPGSYASNADLSAILAGNNATLGTDPSVILAGNSAASNADPSVILADNNAASNADPSVILAGNNAALGADPSATLPGNYASNADSPAILTGNNTTPGADPSATLSGNYASNVDSPAILAGNNTTPGADPSVTLSGNYASNADSPAILAGNNTTPGADPPATLHGNNAASNADLSGTSLEGNIASASMVPDREATSPGREQLSLKELMTALSGKPGIERSDISSEGIKRFLESAVSYLENARELSHRSGDEAMAAKVDKAMNSMKTLLKLNDMYAYAEVPVKNEDENKQTHLRFFANKKSRIRKDEGSSAVLHLNMPSLKELDVKMVLKGNSLKVDFFSSKDASALLEADSATLSERLKKIGVEPVMDFKERTKDNPALDPSDIPGSEISSVSQSMKGFDTRA